VLLNKASVLRRVLLTTSLPTDHTVAVCSAICVLQGGGLFMRGLQNDKLGSSGQALLHNVTLVNNTAGFGGAIACDSCRAVLVNTSILHNTAVRRETDAPGSQRQQQQQKQDQPVSMHITGPEVTAATTTTSSSSVSSSSSSGNASALLTCEGDDVQAAPAALMAYQVRGAGGAIAANMAGNSFLVLCGSSSSGGGSSNAVLNNHARAVGGAFYVNYTSSAGCAGPRLDKMHTITTCFAGVSAGEATAAGFGQLGCGLTTVNVDWSNSSSDAGGDLLGWAGADGFTLICSSSSSSDGSCSGLPANSSSLIAVGTNSSSNSSSNNSTQQLCIVRYTARDASACLPESLIDQQRNSSVAAAPAAAANSMNITGPELRFELPTSLGVFNSTCLKQQEKMAKLGQEANMSSCAVAGLQGAAMPKVFSGGKGQLVLAGVRALLFICCFTIDVASWAARCCAV
jgi:predicted outer membrane repeat protein